MRVQRTRIAANKKFKFTQSRDNDNEFKKYNLCDKYTQITYRYFT